MSSTTTYERGDVVVVNVPFSTQTGAKPRPAAVVSAAAFHGLLPDVIVCPISSQPHHSRRPGPGDVPLQRWKAVGLRHPSAARVSNLLAVEKSLIKRVLGHLASDDLARLERELRAALGLG
jgi:mRNA interferase MazF